MSGRLPEPVPVRTAPFFDHGLFLLHLNRGKEELRRGRHDEARRELEEARRYRPHDPEVLASLSFALFHVGQYEEAETVTREVLASHPSSVPLLFNLGLILFKAGRAAEAREPLEKVLAAQPGHRKAHLTYGLVLQRLGETDRAKEQFRRAGADRAAGGDDDDTVSRAARVAVTASPAAPAAPAAFVEEEADAGEVRQVRTAPIVKPEAFDSRTGAPAPPVATAEVRPGPRVRPSVPSTPPRDDGVVAPPVGPFTPMPGGFLVANARSGLVVRRTALSGRRGSPVLEAEKGDRGAFESYLVRASGPGSVLLLSRGRRPYLLQLEGDFLSVDPARVLAFEAGLAFREDPAFDLRRQVRMPFLKLFGTGAVALAVASEPALFDVDPASPLTLTAEAVLGYSGEVEPELLEGTDPNSEVGGEVLLRFGGQGTILAVSG